MGLNEWLSVLAALGGLEAIRWVVTFLVNRKTDARKEDATADSMEDENERKQVDWFEKRLAERDLKIDALYRELREEQASKLLEVHKRYEVELKLKDAEHNKCDMPDSECHKRIPPRRQLLIKEREEQK